VPAETEAEMADGTLRGVASIETTFPVDEFQRKSALGGGNKAGVMSVHSCREIVS
jgi:hypothetical protein